MTATSLMEKNGKKFYYKYCKDPRHYDDFFLYFQMEYDSMERLKQLMDDTGKGSLYTQLFPLYYTYSCTTSKQPFICMEYITGCSLEEKLSAQYINKNEPFPILNAQQILHLYEQLNTALYWLSQVGIFYLDLNPKNILVLNNNYDIKLIDFTNCYYQNKPDIPYRVLDNRISQKSPIGVQLRDAGALLFTRLFFYGQEHYNNYFSLNTLNNKTFFSRFGSLLDCLFYPDELLEDSEKHPLSYWEDWYTQLLRRFS